MKSLGLQIALAIFLVLPVAALQKPEPQQVTLPTGSALVAEVKGKVSVTPPQGAAAMAQRGMVLPAETAIETVKGSVILLLADGSQLLVKNKTRVVLKSPDSSDGNFLQMFVGEILANIKKRLGETPPFRMGTPSAVITVRGTRFTVQVDKRGRTAVQVFEGIVEVEGLTEKPRAVLVEPGYETKIDPGRPPQLPQAIDQLGLMGPRMGSQAPAMGPPGAGQRPGTGQQPSGSENKPEGPDD
ncbi:MAG TPA: FecR family protein [Terriglobales bacterium]|nr:FecR family protein [Terriglobales bacterium]